MKMSIARVKLLLQGPSLFQTGMNNPNQKLYQLVKRSVTTTPSGSLRPEPPKTPFGFLGIICAVIPGLLIGATISKNMANFLEENELFVPSDDDDDDD